MAEAFAVVGLISAVTQLSELGFKLTKRLDDFASAVNGTRDFVSSIKIRLVLLRQALENVRGQALGGSVDKNAARALSDVVSSILGRFQYLAMLLDKAAPQGKFSKLEKRVNAVKSLGHDRKMQKILAQLQDDVQLLTLSLVSGVAGRAQDLSEQSILDVYRASTKTGFIQTSQLGLAFPLNSNE